MFIFRPWRACALCSAPAATSKALCVSVSSQARLSVSQQAETESALSLPAVLTAKDAAVGSRADVELLVMHWG